MCIKSPFWETLFIFFFFSLHPSEKRSAFLKKRQTFRKSFLIKELKPNLVSIPLLEIRLSKRLSFEYGTVIYK